MAEQTIALSYSRLSDYRACPLKFFLKYIEKAPNFKEDGDSNPHFIRGKNVHSALETYVIKKRAGEQGIRPTSLPEVERTKPLVDRLMAKYDLYPEHQIAIDKDFNQVDWFSKDAWFRIIYDLIGLGTVDLFLGDYKTGKIYDYEGSMEKPGQLHLGALIGMTLYPKFDIAHSMYIYVDHKKTTPFTLSRDHYGDLKQRLIEEHEQVNTESDWAPCANQYCKWCPATKDQCQYSRKMVTAPVG